jgi:TolB-like protein
MGRIWYGAGLRLRESNMASLWRELRRRDVVRVATAYAIVSWLTLQLTDVLISLLSLPDSTGRIVFILVVIGFPVTLILAWVFELTPEGVKKTADVEEEISSAPASRHKLNYLIAGALLSALGFVAWEQVRSIRAPAEVVAADAAKTIAVLPFVSMSSGEDDGYFADGLSEEILNSLAKTSDLLVTARTSSFAYKDTKEDVPTIAAELGVNHILEGSMRRSEGRLRVTAQLIRAEDGFHIWSETFDSTSTNIIAIQENIAIAIANALETVMDPEALAEMMRGGTRSVPAYEALLAGAGVWTAANNDIYLRLEAQEWFEKAAALDPEFTRAYDRLYWHWQMLLPTSNFAHGISGLSYDEIVQKRDEALDNAIRTEKDPSTRLKFLAMQAADNMNPELSLRLIDEFLEQNPEVGTGRAFRGGVLKTLRLQDRLDEIVENGYRKGEIPDDRVHRFLGALEYSQNSDLIRTIARDTLERFGHDHTALYQVHYSLLNAGDIDGAAGVLSEYLKVSKTQRRRYLANMRQACAELRIADAQRIYAEARQAIPDSLSLNWLTNKIIGYDEIAAELFREYDERGEFFTIYSYLTYGYFDAKVYPNFMAAVVGQGVRDRPITEIPYRCNR